jgi:hypothetical protein
MNQVEDPRRVPRLTAHCHVQVRDRFATWDAQTDDLGPRGCQLSTPRAANVGDLVTLTISSPLVESALHVVGLVCWARPLPDARLGVAFSGTNLSSLSPERWFERLVASDPAARVRGGRRTLESGDLVFLGEPPEGPLTLALPEVRLLRAIGGGAPVSKLRLAAGGARFEHTLFSLLSRRLVTLVRAAAAPAARWERRLDEAELAATTVELARTAIPPSRTPVPGASRAAPAGWGKPPAATPRNADAQRLYERAVALLTAGNATAAEALVRSAVALAPEDAVLQSVLRRFTR